jgi:hypothetical protein
MYGVGVVWESMVKVDLYMLRKFGSAVAITAVSRPDRSLVMYFQEDGSPVTS